MTFPDLLLSISMLSFVIARFQTVRLVYKHVEQ